MGEISYTWWLRRGHTQTKVKQCTSSEKRARLGKTLKNTSLIHVVHNKELF